MLVVPEHNLLLLPVVPWQLRLQPLFNGRPIPQLDLKGVLHFAVPNTPAVHTIAHEYGNYGFPHPMDTDVHYDWCQQTPFESQRETARMLAVHHSAFVLNELGTGKTLAALLAMDWLMLRGYARKALVIAPLSTLFSVWEAEIRNRCRRLYPIVLLGTARQRKTLLEADGWNTAIINYDGVRAIGRMLEKENFDLLVVDELATLRNGQTARWRAVNKLARQAKWRWGLTGAPTPNAPTDAFGQIRLIKPSALSGSFSQFRHEIMTPGHGIGEWHPKPDALTTVHKIMQPAVRFKRSQVIELPERYYLDRKVAMSMAQSIAYEHMRKHCLIEHQKGNVTAVNAAVLTGKLLQIASGAVYTDARDTIDLMPAARLATAQEVIDGSEGKVIIFAPYHHNVAAIAAKLTAAGGRELRVITGETDAKERAWTFREFQDENSPVGLLVAHPVCMAHGVTLTAANTIIWWSCIPSNDTYEQANGRITRPGQSREQIVMHLSGSPIETKIFSVLKHRQSMQNSLLKLFEEAIQLQL